MAECEALGRQRYAIFGSERLEAAELGEIGWTDILSFMRRSGRFSQQEVGV